MNRNKLSIKTIVAIGIGAAVFIILSRFASIPTFIPNTNVETAYAFLALMAVIYGPVAGLSIGFIGQLLKDLILYGSPWISWIIASGVFGLIVGLSQKKLEVDDGEFGTKKIIIFNIYQILANVLAWVVVAPGLDVIIYAEPARKVFIQGTISCGFNILMVGILGSILIGTYSRTRIKKGSLRME